MSTLPRFTAVPLSTDEIDDPSGSRKAGNAPKLHAEEFAIYVGALVPSVGRPVALVTYRRSGSAQGEARREAATYGAFFTHESDSFSAALCQRAYVRGVHPRLGAKAMIERGRDEAELALGRWLAQREQNPDHPFSSVGAFEMQRIGASALFGLYVFSPAVRACVQACASVFANERFKTLLTEWASEVGVNTVSLHTHTVA